MSGKNTGKDATEDTGKDRGKVQGEGDYEAARRYRGDVRDYLRKNDPKQAAEQAAAAIEGGERTQLDEAERKGKSKARH